MGKMSRSKGYRGEKAARELLKRLGYKVTWHNEDPDLPDLTAEKNGIPLLTEVKFRAGVPKTIYKYLNQDDSSDLALVKRVSNKDRGRPWLVIMDLDTFDEIIDKLKGENQHLKNKHKTMKIFK